MVLNITRDIFLKINKVKFGWRCIILLFLVIAFKGEEFVFFTRVSFGESLKGLGRS